MPPSTEGYIVTESKNRISRKANIKGSKHIIVGGKTVIHHGCTLRGDLVHQGNQSAAITIGKFCVLGTDVTIEPPGRIVKDTQSYLPVKIGDHVVIGDKTSIQAASIGSCVYIGKDCSIGKAVIIMDNIIIKDGSVIPDYAVLSPFSVFGGRPGVQIASLPESAPEIMQAFSIASLDGKPFDTGFLWKFGA